MNNELSKVIRPDEYNVYRIRCIHDENIIHHELEVETNTKHIIGEEIIIGYEDIEYRCEILHIQNNLYKHRLSETVVRWQFSHLYILKESVCQESEKLKESMGAESKTP